MIKMAAGEEEEFVAASAHYYSDKRWYYTRKMFLILFFSHFSIQLLVCLNVAGEVQNVGEFSRNNLVILNGWVFPNEKNPAQYIFLKEQRSDTWIKTAT